MMATSNLPPNVTVVKDAAVVEYGADLDVLIEEHQKEVRQYPDFTMGAGEPFLHYVKRMCLEGHTYFDAWLISAGAIGQVMMTTPNAWYQMGLIPGLLIVIWGTLVGIWTIVQMVAMYFDRKRDLVVQGQWFDDPDKPHGRKNKSQSQETFGYYLGPWGIRAITIMSCFGWFGTGVAQILASATNTYSIDQSYDLRTYILIYGATLLPFGLIPDFRKCRIILIIGVAGTLYAGAYGIYISAHKGFGEAKFANLWPAQRKGALPIQPFFNGAAILFSIIDHNGIVSETIEAMQKPQLFFRSYMWGFWPLVFMIVPPGILLNLAFAKSGIATAGNWFQLAPMGIGKQLGVWLMNLHNIQAWVLWMTAFGFLWEKAIGTHHKPTWIRLSSRLPLLLGIWLFAAAFPFYGAVNSFISGLFSPLMTYTVPCGIFLWHYRHKEHRDKCTYNHMRRVFEIFGWRWVAIINTGLIVYGCCLVAMTCTMSTINLAQLSKTFGFFPACYNCENYRKG